MVATEEVSMDPETEARIQSWLDGGYDEATKDEIRRLLKDNPKQLVDGFYTSLKFGTGGLRGIMGVGTNRMNVYTVRAATQGLANYLDQHAAAERSVFIGYDCRNRSPEFAMEAARVLAGNGIKVHLCPELRTTPFVSFGCRYNKCSAAIMITASHNPPAYNGYKVYWADGGQIVAPHDHGIINEVEKITDIGQVKLAEESDSLIQMVGEEQDEAYWQALQKLQLYPEENQNKGKELRVVYANLHGTGITHIPEVLKRWGFTDYHDVEEQKEPNGNFPTVESPNPEERDALKMGIEKLKEVEGDLLLATDPDSDRMAAVVRDGDEIVLLNGNQIACVALKHICEAYGDKLPANGAFVKTIVTTELFRAIAEGHDRPCYNVLTGFKFIAEKIHEWDHTGEHEYLFGGEESYGYLLGTHARDKDAVISCALLTEAASHAKQNGETLVDILNRLYDEYGVYREQLASIKFPETKEGRDKMASALVSLRATPPKEFGGVPVVAVEDYQTSTKTWLTDGHTEQITLPQSNVLLYWLADESKVVVRPSGTEPKVKVYCGVVNRDDTTRAQRIETADQHANNLIAACRAAL